MSDTNMNYMYTVGAYAALFGLGYVIYQVSTQKGRKRVGATAAKATKAVQPEGRKEDRKKKQRQESFASVAQESSKLSKAKAPAQSPEPNPFLSNDDTPDDGAANREFAKQLAKAKEGAKFAANNDGRKQREKSVKQSRANKVAGIAEDKTSAQSSTTGAEADDDQSPVASPESPPADASGVADMLAPAASSGPSVLRLTDTTEKKQKKPAKAPEPVESKKQRQNRKKAEAAKAARQESEQDRKALEEKQRRQARIAEGRAAKDGSQFLASNGNKSAWTQGAPNGDSNTSAKVSSVPESAVFHAPLDTFEEPAASAVKKQPASSKSEWLSSLPSEEEQMELLKVETDDWNTVKTKSSKKASKKGSSVDSGDEPTQNRPAAQPKQSTSTVSGSKSKAAPTQSFGSFSALTTNDDGADEAEEEWEV